MEITSAYLKKLKNRKGKPWQGNIKYRDPDNVGKYKTISKTFDRDTVKTKTDAMRALETWRAGLEAEDKKPSTTDKAQMPVYDYIDSYIDQLKSMGRIEPSTENGYRISLKHIGEAFDGVALGDLEADDIEEWEKALVARGLSASTVGKAHRILKQALQHAVDTKVILWNPCNPVKPPKRVSSSPNALDRDGVVRLRGALSAMERTPVVLAAYIALYTGLRRGEICALAWGDVDLDRDEITVSHAIGVGAGGCYLKDPKTNIRRTIPIDGELRTILEEHRRDMRARWAEARFSWGLPTTDEDFSELYVIGSLDGRFANPTRLGKEWATLSRLLNLVGTEGRLASFHDLRHTYGSLAIHEGADVTGVSKNMGHASIKMTLDTYSTADAESRRRTARLVADAIERDKPADVLQLRTGTES